MANKVTIEIEGRFIDNVTDEAKDASKSLVDLGKDAEKAQKKLDQMGKKKVEPKLDADDSKLLRKLKQADAKVDKLTKTNRAVTLTAKDKASAIINKIVTKSKSIAGKTWKATVGLKDTNAVKTLQKVGEMGKSIGGKTWTAMVKVKDFALSPLKKIKDTLFSIKSLIAAVTAGFAAQKLVLAPINLADQYSSAKIGFSTLLGDAAGQKMMDDLDEFAKVSPFDTSGVISNAQKMLAMGWNAESIVEDMKIIGNAAASTGNLNQGLESIVRAMAQIKTKGKLSAEELNQLAEAGISAKAMLAEELGYGTGDAALAKFSKDQEAGVIGAEKALQALLRGMRRYDGMMDSMANETAEGLMSQLKDTFQVNILRKWGQGLQDGAKKGLGSLVALVDKADEALASMGETLYDLGESVSNWAADKLENAVKKVQEITASEEFKNADIGGKVKMLWKGVIANPLAEWWNSTVVPWWEATAVPWLSEKAAKAGEAMGKGLTSGLLALFGVTDLADEGVTIAGSFVQGFKDGFDGSAITEAFVDAISNVWSALPWWAKLLIGGYGASRVAGGIGNIAGGISTLAGGATKLFGSAAAGTGLLGFGSNAAIAMGAGNLAGGASLGAGALSALGLAGTAGIAGGVITAGSGAVDLYSGYKNDDDVAKKSGWWKVGGAGGGAAAGAAIGSVIPGVGTLVGAGVGALAGSALGWLQSKRIKKEAAESAESLEALAQSESAAAEEARKLLAENKKLAAESLAEHFGDVALSAAEMEKAIGDIIGQDHIDRIRAATVAIDNMNQSFSAFESQESGLKKSLWMASVKKNAQLTADEMDGIQNASKSFRDSAQAYVTDAHYASTESIKSIMGNSAAAEKLIESTNAYYQAQGDELSALSGKLNDALYEALRDNVITVDEKKSLDEIRNSISNIIRQIQEEEYEAEINILKAKYAGDLTSDGFGELMQGTAAQAKTMAESYWDEFGQASIGKSQEEIEILRQGVLDQLSGLWSNAGDLGIGTLRETYQKELGILGQEIGDILANNTPEEIMKAVNGMDEKTRQGIAQLLEYMEPTTAEVEKLVKAYKDAGLQIPEALSSYLQDAKFYEALSKGTEAIEEYFSGQKFQIKPEFEINPETFESTSSAILDRVFTVPVNVEAEWTYNPFNETWISPDNQYYFTTEALIDTGWTYNAFDKTWISPDGRYTFHTDANVNATWNVDKFGGTAGDFGINKSYGPYKTQPSISPTFSVLNTFSPTMSTWGLKSAYSYFPTINLNPTVKTPGSARGNIWYPSGVNTKGYAAGGIVRGGARLIRVAEEGSPEMIIPLSSQRRERGLKLWEKAGNMLGVPGFARGGLTRGNTDEGIRFRQYGSDETPGGTQTVQVDVGGITVEISVDAKETTNIVDAIKEQANEVAEVVAGIINDALAAQFVNTPTRGGAY